MPDIGPRLARSARVVPILLGLALLLPPLSPAAQGAITRPFEARRESLLSPGIRFAVGGMRTTGGRIQSVRVGSIDGTDPAARVRSLLSNDVVIRRELPSRLARRKSGPGNLAMVATNGDTTQRMRTDAYAAPHSMHISNGELMVVQACVRPTLGIDSQGRARIAEVRAELSVNVVGRQAVKRIHRVNTHRDDALVVLFTRRFGPSTQTAPGGVEVVLSLPDLLRPHDVQVLDVLQVRRGAGDTPLRAGQAVLSVSRAGARWVKELRVGQRLRLETTIVRRVDAPCGGALQAAGGWEDIVEAMGGNHFTARNGRVAAPSRSAYPAGSERHPRTNVGVTPDGRVLMVTVDGRQPGYSIGVTLAEMGALMVSLGAQAAFNLDGGGSTMMAMRPSRSADLEVHDRPSDGRERSQSQALAAFHVFE